MPLTPKGFTLLELLIVIAILAILSAVTIIVLNPAELLRKSRDSRRLSDIATLKTAIAFYIINTSSPSLANGNDAVDCVDGSAKKIFSHQTVLSLAPANWTLATSAVQFTDGSGWVKVNLAQLFGGAPIAKIPMDPSNSGPAAGADNDFYYSFACHNGNDTYEIDANMESVFYKNGGVGDVESKDGGDISTIFEDGTALNLLPTSTMPTGSSGAWYQGE